MALFDPLRAARQRTDADRNNGKRILADGADRADRSMWRERAWMQTPKELFSRSGQSLAPVRTIRMIRSIRFNPHPVLCA
jgi:hypothetical protein